MANFIKLTSKDHNDKYVWVNPETISWFHQLNENTVTILFGDKGVRVRETPEEILAMIEALK